MIQHELTETQVADASQAGRWPVDGFLVAFVVAVALAIALGAAGVL
jgi:hypothetical protein